jgi:hypothetical protein
MSANADVLQGPELLVSPAQENATPRVAVVCETNSWNPEDFGREQIRGLVRQVFFASGAQPVKQVVLSAVGSNPDLTDLCDQVGQALALETRGHIAIVGREQQGDETFQAPPLYVRNASIKSWSRQTAVNLWRVPGCGLRQCAAESGTGPYWLSCLADLRNEFEYAVIHGPAAGISSEAALLGQLADGIILVLGAHSTRKATARKIKQTLEAAQSRILGTVLNERRFPVPEQIYRRL